MFLWVTMGLVVAIWGYSTIGVIALQPLPNQHGIVGMWFLLGPFLFGWAAWHDGAAPHRAAAVAVATLIAAFAAAMIQPAIFTGAGGHTMTPLLFVAAILPLATVPWLGHGWPEAAASAAFLAAAMVLAVRSWDSASDATLAWYGALISTLPLLVYVAAFGIGATVRAKRMPVRDDPVPA